MLGWIFRDNNLCEGGAGVELLWIRKYIIEVHGEKPSAEISTNFRI